MRTQVTVGIALLLCFGAIPLLLGDALAPRLAAADEKPAPSGVWTYQIRVVRVDPATKEGAEAPDPFGGGMTTKLAWREALGLLKQRGATTILMDQNISTMSGEKASGHSERVVPIMALNFASKGDEQKRASNIKTGCKLDLTPTETRLLYGLRVQWALQAAKSTDAPEQFVAEWYGSHPPLRGETLVLHYGEQVAQGDATRAVEIYALVTGQYVP